jgi:hypothetical protein
MQTWSVDDSSIAADMLGRMSKKIWRDTSRFIFLSNILPCRESFLKHYTLKHIQSEHKILTHCMLFQFMEYPYHGVTTKRPATQACVNMLKVIVLKAFCTLKTKAVLKVHTCEASHLYWSAQVPTRIKCKQAETYRPE